MPRMKAHDEGDSVPSHLDCAVGSQSAWSNVNTIARTSQSVLVQCISSVLQTTRPRLAAQSVRHDISMKTLAPYYKAMLTAEAGCR